MLSLIYAVVSEWVWRGQTVGKRLMGLRVVDARGLRLEPSQVIVRNLMRLLDALPALYLVGGIACVFSRHRQRLGDLAAGTVVVRTSKIAQSRSRSAPWPESTIRSPNRGTWPPVCARKWIPKSPASRSKR